MVSWGGNFQPRRLNLTMKFGPIFCKFVNDLVNEVYLVKASLGTTRDLIVNVRASFVDVLSLDLGLG